MNKPYIKKMIELGLLTGKRTMLDLGCGNGSDSDFFKGIGYEVTSVDFDDYYRGAIKADIADFNIEKGKYGVILCYNALPFIADKRTVKKILRGISQGLTPEGIACITVFGPKDGWVSHKTMSFFEPGEISTYLESIGMLSIERTVTEGLGRTISGEVKFWHIIRFILKNGSK